MKFSATIIVAFLAISILLVLFYSHQHYQNINIHEEGLGLSLYYMENITKIDSAIINLNFVENEMEFTSKFYVIGTGIKLDSGSKGFQDNDNKCSDDLFLELSDGTGQGLVWHDRQPVSFEEYGKVNFVELTKTCKFNKEIIPNGEFTVHLFGENQTEKVIIDDVEFLTSFDSKIFDCDDECVFARNFVYTDFINTEKSIRDVLLEGINVDTRRMEFDLRAVNVENERLSSNFLTAFLVGIGVASTIIVSIFSHEQQTKLSEAINRISGIAGQQQKITDEQIKTRDHKRKRYAKMILFVLGQIDYQLDGLLLQQKLRDEKDVEISDDERRKMEKNYYEKAQKEFLEMGVEYDDILDVFNPKIEKQYRNAWNSLRTPLLYFKDNFDDSKKMLSSMEKIYDQFGKLKDLLIEYVDTSEKGDYSSLFDLEKFKKTDERE